MSWTWYLVACLPPFHLVLFCGDFSCSFIWDLFLCLIILAISPYLFLVISLICYILDGGFFVVRVLWCLEAQFFWLFKLGMSFVCVVWAFLLCLSVDYGWPIGMGAPLAGCEGQPWEQCMSCCVRACSTKLNSPQQGLVSSKISLCVCVACGANWVVLWCGPNQGLCWSWGLLEGHPVWSNVRHCQ